ncbi:MAG: hypothetical protein C4530_01240 [Desulfobacteraceae bacterium]|nr:MAG: hypothetical protein C4530_01240 [Desulfobacteraceae bacterium]
MKRKAALFIVFGIVIAGCATLSDMNRMDRFNRTANGYRLAIRWSDFDAAENYAGNPGHGDDGRRAETPKDVQVISYEVRDIVLSPDLSKVHQAVEIRYYRLNRMIEKTIRIDESWEYDSDAQRWFLKEGFPRFE